MVTCGRVSDPGPNASHPSHPSTLLPMCPLSVFQPFLPSTFFLLGRADELLSSVAIGFELSSPGQVSSLSMAVSHL